PDIRDVLSRESAPTRPAYPPSGSKRALLLVNVSMQSPPTTRPMSAFQPFPAALCLCALTAPGCASMPAAPPPPGAASPPAELPPSAPSVRSAENGMEMMWWGVSTTSRTLAELLAPSLDDSLGIDPRTRALWQSNGL